MLEVFRYATADQEAGATSLRLFRYTGATSLRLFRYAMAWTWAASSASSLLPTSAAACARTRW